MTTTAQQLRDKFEADLEALQDACLHTETEQLPYSYAMGHYYGYVTICKVCEKEI